jgi:putative FmdB family regulatory protein
VPVYEFRCDCGQGVEVLTAPGLPSPACPACGGETRKVVSGFAVGGRADPGLSQSQMPQTWKGTYGGNREYITSLQCQWERRQRLEDRYPELAGDRRPIVAHEGPYSTVPLRAGHASDPRADSAGGASGAGSVGEGQDHAHRHGHLHTHP